MIVDGSKTYIYHASSLCIHADQLSRFVSFQLIITLISYLCLCMNVNSLMAKNNFCYITHCVLFQWHNTYNIFEIGNMNICQDIILI